MNARISPSIAADSLHPVYADERPKVEEARSVEEGIALYLPELERRARNLVRDGVAAQDLVQDTVERALRFKDTFYSGGYLRAWLLRIMKNVFISQRRRLATERRVLEGAKLDPNGWASLRPTLQAPDLSPPVKRALKEMPKNLRRVVQFVDLHEASYRDAAEREQVPVGTIMSRLHRGRARLAAALIDPVAA